MVPGVVLAASRLCPIAQRSYLQEKLGGMNGLQEQMEVVPQITGILQ
jgi:hypothetical protein